MYSKPNLINALHRLRKPAIPPEKIAAAEARSWQAVQQRLQPTHTMSIIQPKRTQFAFSPVFAFALLILIVSGTYIAANHFTPQAAKEIAQSISSPATSPTPQSSALAALISQSSNNTAVDGKQSSASFGYIKKSVSLNKNVAYAADSGIIPATYTPTLFYQQDVAGDLNGRSNIYMANLQTGQKTALTGVSASDSALYPAFSSTNQVLAYTNTHMAHPEAAQVQNGNVGESCTVQVINTATMKNVRVIENGDDCYSTLSWSPDGKYLLLSHVPAGSDKGSMKLALYTVSTGKTVDLSNPEGLSPDFQIQWLNNQTFTDTYESNDLKSNPLIKTDVTTGVSMVVMKDFSQFQSYRLVGDQLFYSPTPTEAQIATQTAPPLHVQTLNLPSTDIVITGTDTASSYIPRLNATGTPDGVIFSKDNLQNSQFPTAISLTTLPENTTRLVAGVNVTHSEGFIGFYTDYNQVLYQALPAGSIGDANLTEEVHLLNLTTGEDKVILSGAGAEF